MFAYFRALRKVKKVFLAITLLIGALFYTAVGLNFFLGIDVGFNLFSVVVSSPILLIQAAFHSMERDWFLAAMEISIFAGAVAVVGSQVYFSVDYSRWKKRNNRIQTSL